MPAPQLRIVTDELWERAHNLLKAQGGNTATFDKRHRCRAVKVTTEVRRSFGTIQFQTFGYNLKNPAVA